MAASEFQRTLMSYLSRQGMSVASLGRHTGCSPLLLENLIAGKTRQIPVDFFVRVADALGLSTAEKDALYRKDPGAEEVGGFFCGYLSDEVWSRRTDEG